MSFNDKKLEFRLKQMGLQEGSKSIEDYEKAKKMLRDQCLSPEDFQNAIRKTTDFIKCQY